MPSIRLVCLLLLFSAVATLMILSAVEAGPRHKDKNRKELKKHPNVVSDKKRQDSQTVHNAGKGSSGDSKHKGHNPKKDSTKEKHRGYSPDKPQAKKTKKEAKERKHQEKKAKKEGQEHGFAVDNPRCGEGAGNCPGSLPCCSQWGWCGSGPDYCSHSQGCQGQFGQCDGGQTPAKKKHRSKKKKNRHHGFDLGERRRRLASDGKNRRIGPLRAKLPVNDTLVNIAYFPGWTQYRGQGRNHCRQRPYLPTSVPWSSLDYVIFAFVYFDDDQQLYPADPSDEELYLALNELKQPTSTRVLISIGGWSFTHPENRKDESTRHRFENMVRSPPARKAFIQSCIEFCSTYGFDGVDIDNEYPAYQDREMTTALFKEMREAFDAEGSGLVLSLAGASFAEGVRGLELDKVASYVDFMMIMAYDLYGAYDSSQQVNIHTALVQMPTETHSGHSVQGAVEMYLDRGVPRQKIVLGLALYGKTFVLADAHQTLPGRARFSAGGDPTNCIETRGDAAYNEIAAMIHPSSPQQPSIRPQWDEDGKGFYFVYGDRNDNWVGYDDRPSLDLKLQMVTELDLAGVMWWSLDQDLDATSLEQNPALFKKPSKSHDQEKRAIPQAPFHAPLSVLKTVPDTDPSSAHVVEAVTQPHKMFLPTEALLASKAAPTEAMLVKEAADAVGNQTKAITCPKIVSPPAWMATIPMEVLGMPGLVPYVASKRKRCPTVVQWPNVLPATPLGNLVFTRCQGPEGCQESWQAHQCQAGGWSAASTCFDKDQLSPSSYFYGDLELVRTASRDRDIQEAASGVGPSRSARKMNSPVGPKRPAYIDQYRKLTKMQQLMAKLQENEARLRKKQAKIQGAIKMRKAKGRRRQGKKFKKY